MAVAFVVTPSLVQAQGITTVGAPLAAPLELDTPPDVVDALAPPNSVETVTPAKPSTTSADKAEAASPRALSKPNLPVTMAVAGGGALLGVGGTVATMIAITLVAGAASGVSLEIYRKNASAGRLLTAIQTGLALPTMAGALLLPAVGTVVLTAVSNSMGSEFEGEVIGAATGAALGWLGVGAGIAVPLWLILGTQGQFTQSLVFFLAIPGIFLAATGAAVGGAVAGTFLGHTIGTSFMEKALVE